MAELVIKDTTRKKKLPLNNVTNKIIHGDALKVLAKLEGECADMVFVDPPYNLQLPNKRLVRWSGTKVDGVNDDWDSFRSFEEYDDFALKWLTEVKRLMKPSATIWVIGSYHHIFRTGRIMQDLGYWILNDVIWLKRNPVPNFLKVRFTNATETMIWAVKDKSAKGHTFNSDFAKEFGVGKVGANVWEIPLCAGRERLKGDDGKKVHSTQKPEELLKRLMLVSTNEGDVVLDPMAGTGTTAAVAAKLGRRFIAVERQEVYVKAMEKRLGEILHQKNIFPKKKAGAL